MQNVTYYDMITIIIALYRQSKTLLLGDQYANAPTVPPEYVYDCAGP